MIILDQIVGHKRVVGNLKQALKTGRTPSAAFLFCGPSGIGKKKAAMGWAQGLFCEDPSTANRPCGKCTHCLRLVKGHHPDLMIVSSGDSPTLKIEQIRDVQNFVSLKSFEGRAKVVLIDEAQTMTTQSSNALLKTLEEPPEHCHFLLITSNKAAILPTILSRCQKVLFGLLTLEEMKRILPDMEPWVFELSQGRVDLAQRFTDESYRTLRASALKVFKDVSRVRLFEGFTQLIPLLEDRESALFATHCWGQWSKQALALQLGVEQFLSPDERAVVEEMTRVFPQPALQVLGQKILRLEQDIQANINKNLAFEKFWIDIQRETHVTR